jgi:hypothetical protein
MASSMPPAAEVRVTVAPKARIVQTRSAVEFSGITSSSS